MRGGGTYGRFPRVFSVLFQGFLLRAWIVLGELLRLVLPDQGFNVDLEMTSCFLGFVVRILIAKACDEQVRGRLVPWVSRCPLQVDFEVFGRARELVAHWVVSVHLVFGEFLLKRTIFRNAQ